MSLRKILAEEGLLRSAARVIQKKVDVWGTEYVFTLTASQDAALKLIPGGSGRKMDFNETKGEFTGATWRKGGYIDALTSKFWPAVKAAGFRDYDRSEGGTPDGAHSHSAWVGRDSEGNLLTFSSHIGVTKSENGYTIELKFRDPPKLMDVEWVEKRDRANLEEKREALAAEVVSSVQGLEQNLRLWGGNLRGELPVSALPDWLKTIHAGNPRMSRTLIANPREAFAMIQVDQDPSYKKKTLIFEAKYDPDSASSLVQAIGRVLSALSRSTPR